MPPKEEADNLARNSAWAGQQGSQARAPSLGFGGPGGCVDVVVGRETCRMEAQLGTAARAWGLGSWGAY